MRRLGNSWYANPGSVSLAYNWELSDLATGQMRVDPWADYAIVSSEGAGCWAVAFSGINMRCPQKRHEYVARHAQVAGVTSHHSLGRAVFPGDTD